MEEVSKMNRTMAYAGTTDSFAAGKWGETLIDDITADKISKITATLQANSSLTDAINSANTAGDMNLTLDAGPGIIIYCSRGTDSNGSALSGAYDLASGGTLRAKQ
jgi:hypothetical protein